MRISELIKKLEEIKESKGDIRVQVFNHYRLEFKFNIETYRDEDTDEITVALAPEGR